MRSILAIILLVPLLNTILFADLIEFQAGASNSIQIPAGTAIQINGTSTKGDAAPYMKFRVIKDEISYEISDPSGFGGLYLNGPASISLSPVTNTSYVNIPYKLYRTDAYILNDPAGNGQFTNWISAQAVTMNIDTNGMIIKTYEPEYQAYLNWKNAGNNPLPADAYTGTNIASSGYLVDFTRYSNQPFRTILLSSGTTNTLTIPSGRKIICQNINFFAPLVVYDREGVPSTTITQSEPPGLSAKIRGYYLPSREVEGPEQLTISYNSSSYLGAGGSATFTTGGQQGPSFGVFAYYYADESAYPLSDSYVTDLTTKITSTSGNYGLATKNELNSALAQSRADGINSVISNPNLWTLYTTDQIQNMAMGNLVLNKNTNGVFSLNYDIEQSSDLQTWTPYQALSLPLSGLPTNKAFVRIKLKNSQ